MYPTMLKNKDRLSFLYPTMCARLVHSTFVFRWLRMVGPSVFAKESLVSPTFGSTPWSASVLLSAQGTTAESMNTSALFAVGWFFPLLEAPATPTSSRGE
jgi:hypothetical protein